MANQLSILNEEQVRRLASVIRYKEANAIQTIHFNTEAEQSKYLYDSKWNYDTVVALLDAVVELKSKYEEDEVRGPIAEDIYSYVVYCANAALQTVQNYKLRMEYLKKVKEHADSLMDELKKEPLDSEKAKTLAEEAANSRTMMLDYLRNYQSTASHNFSLAVKNAGTTFEQLVQKYQVEAGYGGRPFKELKNEEKITVYDKIIESSGREKVYTTVNKGNKNGAYGQLAAAAGASFPKMSATGVASLLFTAGNMTWDIYTAEHKIRAATRDTVKQVASKVGGALISEVVAAALRSESVAATTEATVLFEVLGTMTSFVSAFMIGVFAGMLFDSFFDSGGAKPLSTQGIKCYVAELPDGIVLARQIAHE